MVQTMADQYNGWANHATWNINLWVDNEEPLYDEMTEVWPTMLSRDGADAEKLAGILFPDGMTPDEVMLSDPGIDWVEIAESWDESCGIDG